jgi:hypothetical protein
MPQEELEPKSSEIEAVKGRRIRHLGHEPLVESRRARLSRMTMHCLHKQQSVKHESRLEARGNPTGSASLAVQESISTQAMSVPCQGYEDAASTGRMLRTAPLTTGVTRASQAI